MIKTAFAAAAAAAAFAAPGAALAGPYVNVETNAGWTGSDYTGATTDFHVGYEGPIGESASYYVQAGASLVTPDGGTDETVPSGKAGVGVALSDALGAYGEVSFIGSGDSSVRSRIWCKTGSEVFLLITVIYKVNQGTPGVPFLFFRTHQL